MGILAWVTGVGGASLLLLGGWRFLRDRREALRQLHLGAQLARTARGEVEYALRGEGPVVLSLHGGLGGWDQGLVIASDWLGLVESGFTVLAPSRPGYLRTPIDAGRTPEEAADAMAALLDTLELSEVIVLGTSGGGPTALQFALRHPARTRALVLLSAITGQHVQPGRTQQTWGRFLFSSYAAWLLDLGWWLVNGLVQRFPRPMVRSMLRATTAAGFKTTEAVDYVMAHPHALAGLKALMQAQTPLSARKVGLDNDLASNAQLPVYPLEQLARPTLVVHGKLDGNVPFSHAQFVAGAVPNAKRYVVEEGGHLVSSGPGAEPMRAAVVAFLQEHAGG